MRRLTPEALAKALVAEGVPHDDAREAGAQLDETMKQCILRLYRSAVHAGRDWLPELARVRFALLANCSHWWQLERPDAVAAELHALWRPAETPPPR